MKLVLALITVLLMLPPVAVAQQPMFPPTVSPFADQTTWLLTNPFRYQILTTTLVIEVPAGFVTDFASIPRFLWTFASPHGFYSRASIIHDFLYWDQQCTREQADRIMLIAMGNRRSASPNGRRSTLASEPGDNLPGTTTPPQEATGCCGRSRPDSSIRSSPSTLGRTSGLG